MIPKSTHCGPTVEALSRGGLRTVVYCDASITDISIFMLISPVGSKSVLYTTAT